MLPMKLNIGCGICWLPGYLNVDKERLPQLAEWARGLGREEAPLKGVDFLHFDIREPWPWQDSSVEEVHANQVLEHLTHAELDHVLAETRRVLQPGAVFVGAVPDFAAIWQAAYVEHDEWRELPHDTAGPYPEPWMNVLQNYAHGWDHRQIFTLDMLQARLAGAGFDTFVQIAPGRNLHFQARVTKPATGPQWDDEKGLSN